MQFVDAIEHVFSNYANFNGRARRSEYWYYTLFYGIVLIALSVLALIPFLGVLIPLFLLATLIPSVAVCWRRLHDVGRSGLWWLISFVPLVGVILLIIWLTGDSQPGTNQYGPNPKGVRGAAAPFSPAPGPAQGGLAIRCLSGPMQGQTFMVGNAGLWFGRASDCGIRFPDGAPGISSHHCCIRWDQGVPVLVDLGSRYGTFLGNGRQLPPNYPEPVAAGTRFYLGSTDNLFQISVFGA